MLDKRLAKNLKRLKGWIKDQNIQAFRLYDRDIPEFPFIIDIYGDYGIVYEKSKVEVSEEKLNENKALIETSLKQVFPEINIIFKMRARQKSKTEYHYKTNYKDKDEYFLVKEHDLSFEIRPYPYIDVGLFLDHRPLRKIVSNLVKENDTKLKLLNLFSYTCSFGVYGASAGAKTTNVDLSKTYLEWGRSNYKHNNLDINEHEFINSDVIEFLKNSKEEGLKFDIIILDPPSFSNSKKTDYTFDIQKAHPEMLKLCLSLLEDSGVIFFSGNLRSFKLDSNLEDAMIIRNISKKSIPIDYRDEKIHFCYEVRQP